MRTMRIITTTILLGVFTLSNAQEVTPNPEAETFLKSFRRCDWRFPEPIRELFEFGPTRR